MVYKIGNLSDLANVPITSSKTFELVYHYARVLTCEYGEDRNVDREDTSMNFGKWHYGLQSGQANAIYGRKDWRYVDGLPVLNWQVPKNAPGYEYRDLIPEEHRKNDG